MSAQRTPIRTEDESILRKKNQDHYVYSGTIETSLIKSAISGRLNTRNTDDVENYDITINTREDDYIDNEDSVDVDVETEVVATTQSDVVLSSDKATIFEVLEEIVRVKMSNGVMINIPKVVFSQRSEVLKYGQPIMYSIKIRPNGFRYQDFEVDPNPATNPLKADVLAALNTIKNVR